MTQTPTPEQLQDALKDIEYIKEEILPTGYAQSVDTIQFALRFTAKALGEPSAGVERVGVCIRNIQDNQNYKNTGYIFKEMIAEIAKECAE